ncbi:BlaI/MecI/CopY family transcriptional regulator [Ruminococcaceae bacterium OttesenSCG-928-O06]|nr:BlaI/MecI/CopY family transcriptional regulator [Ruminococcaceae bacterium OttesenSCG-928-O06]
MADLADRITDAELVVMQAFWQAGGPLTVAQLVQKLCQSTGWKPSTVKTLVRRLVAKNALGPDPAQEHHYRPLVSRRDYGAAATSKLLTTVYQGNTDEMLRAVKQAGAPRTRGKGRA